MEAASAAPAAGPATARANPVDLVLVGGGHSHLGVLLAFARRPLPGVRLTLVSSEAETPYSGMLPGYIAGHYDYDEVHIDLARLAEFAGARFLRDEASGLDRAARRVFCRSGAALAYDYLSINVGATPQLAAVPGAAEHAAPVKPIGRFNERWLALLSRLRQDPARRVIAVVGAGAGGVELTLAMQYRLRREFAALGRQPDANAAGANGDAALPSFHLFAATPTILPTHNAAVRAAFERVLAERGVIVHRDAEVCRVEAGRLIARRGESLAADVIFWVTQAGGPRWFEDTGLALDADGCLVVNDTLQSPSDRRIFAAGDCASFSPRRLEKAGVFAVRMGRPLADNLRRSVLGQPLRPYVPQTRWLALISTGDRHAIASRGAFYARGDWVWRWKDWLDRRFMRRFAGLSKAARRSGAADVVK